MQRSFYTKLRVAAAGSSGFYRDQSRRDYHSDQGVTRRCVQGFYATECLGIGRADPYQDSCAEPAVTTSPAKLSFPWKTALTWLGLWLRPLTSQTLLANLG